MIAFLINDINVKGGTHKQLLKLLDYYTAQGVDFKVITRIVDFDLTYPDFKKYRNKIFEISRIKSKGILTRSINYILSFVSLVKLLNGCNIINIHDGGFEFLLPAFIGKKVYWQINDMHQCFEEGVMNSLKPSIANRLRRYFIQFFGFVITKFTVNVSKNKDLVKKYFKKDAYVFYCGIEKLKIERNNINTFSRFNKKKINLLSSGVFLPYRNYETVVEVVKKLKRRGYVTEISIIGNTTLQPSYTNKIVDLIKSNNLEGCIKICGQINDNEFELLHKNADIFVFINVNQSWGLAVFEAMSCGIPVIVSESVGATEILHDNHNAFFVDPFNISEICDKIIRLTKNESLYSNISLNSKALCDDYTWEKSYCSKMFDLIQNNL